MTTIYLAGPMTGCKDFNFPNFYAAASRLRQGGCTVINPAENHGGRTDLTWQEYMKEALRQVLSVDMVFLLPGWRDSKGAQLEVQVAQAAGIPTHETRESYLLDGFDLDPLPDPSCVTAGHEVRQVGSVRPDDEQQGVVDWAESVTQKPWPTTPIQPYVDQLKDDIDALWLNAANPAWPSKVFCGTLPPRKVITGADQDPQSVQVETVLEEANRLVHGDRQTAYGHPLDDFTKTATLWSVVLGHEVTAEQVALCMVQVKVARELNAHKRDNIVDGAGYFATLQMVVEERERRG